MPVISSSPEENRRRTTTTTTRSNGVLCAKDQQLARSRGERGGEGGGGGNLPSADRLRSSLCPAYVAPDVHSRVPVISPQIFLGNRFAAAPPLPPPPTPLPPQYHVRDMYAPSAARNAQNVILPRGNLACRLIFNAHTRTARTSIPSICYLERDFSAFGGFYERANFISRH